MQFRELSKTAIVEQDVFEGATRSSSPRELRLALSLRGGVSLAVWIGGAVAELDRLRRAPKPANQQDEPGVEGLYRKLCELANYDNVSIDVITGASAGGLNGVLYAASLVYGFDFDKIAQIWVTSTDIEALSRETSGGAAEQARSLLEGDGYFLELVRDELAKLAKNGLGKSSLDDRDPRLELLLTATLADPAKVRFSVDPFADIIDSHRAAFFQFGHLGEVGGPFSDFGWPGDPEAVNTSIAQLALAARASSSFPIAFEPANVGGRDDVEIQGMFSEDVGDGIEVIDGGTLDNIPVKKAIDAIAAAPAQGPTKRWLLYLHPSPDVDTEHGSKQPGLQGVITNMRRAANAAISQESLIEDLIELERHNVGVSEHNAVRDSLISGAIGSGLVPADILLSRLADEAKANWVTVEASRILNLAENPWAAVIDHNATSVATDSVLRDRWPPSAYRMLRQQIGSALEDAGSEPSQRPQIPDLMTITGTLLGWANALQGVELDDAGLETTRTTKRRLYEVRLVLETLTHLWEAAWITKTGGTYPDHGDFAERINESHRYAVRCSEWVRPDIWQRVDQAISGDSVGEVAASGTNAALHEALIDLAGGARNGDGQRTSIAGPLWDILASIAQDLNVATTQVSAKDPAEVEWIRTSNATRESLEALAVLLSPQQSRMAVSYSQIDFARLSGANQPALEEFFGPDPLDAQAKLVGNELANFGAFFTAQGRANDWMWGRIDAAKTIVDVILAGWHSPEDLSEVQYEARIGDAVAAVRAIVTHPFSGVAETSGWNAWTDQLWSESTEEAVEEELREHVAGNSTNELTFTKRLVTRRIQTEILARHQPWVDKIKPVHVDAPTIGNTPAEPDELLRLTSQPAPSIRDFKIPGSIRPIRWASIGMRLGLVAWRALTGRRWGYMLFPLKPLYLYLLAIAVQPRRALFSGMIGFGALAVGDWQTEAMTFSDLCCHTTPDPERSWQRVVAWLIVSMCCISYAWIEYSRRKAELKISTDRTKQDLYLVGRGVLALLILTGVTTSVFGTWVLPPVIVVAAAAVISGLLFSFMRPSFYGATIVWVPCVYLLWAWWSPYNMSRGWWAFIGYLTVTYLVTLAMSSIDIFDPRPRPTASVMPERAQAD